MSEEMLAAAIEYTKKGFVVHPLSSSTNEGTSPGKKPLLPEWQKRIQPATIEELIKWFKNTGNNIGLVCGRGSNIDAFDLDNEFFRDELFDGIELDTLISGHRLGRGHVLFQHEEDMKSEKCHFIGIEYFGNSEDGAGSNLVLPPSVHKSGEVYRFINPDAPLMKMPDKLKANWRSLVMRERMLYEYFKKCRPCFTKGSKLYKKDDPRSKGLWERPDDVPVHNKAGRDAILAIMGELKAHGCPDDLLTMACKRFFGKDYDAKTTAAELKNIKPIHPKCETLRTCLNIDCEGCEFKIDLKIKEPKKSKSSIARELPPIPPIPQEEIETTPYCLEELLKTFKKWLAIKEDYNIVAPVCAFLGNYVPGEPDIIGIVAPSGSTKTEVIRSFGETENQYSYPLSSVTEHTFVSGHEDNIDTVPILRGRVLLIKDLTTLLAKKEDIRAGVFSDFRDITDGYIKKEFGNGIKKEYRGIHSSILFASTNAIEKYYSMYSNLGQRMLFIRPHNDPKEARIQSEKNRGSLEVMRKELHNAMMRFVYTTIEDFKNKTPAIIPEEIKTDIGELCDFLALIRTTIHHDIKGDIDEVPEPEFPTRIYNTICKLTEIHAFVYGRAIADEKDKAFAYRLVYDNIPTLRIKVLEQLTKEQQTTAVISKYAELPTSTGKKVLDDLAALHIVVKVPRDMKDEESNDKRSDSFFVDDYIVQILNKLRGVIRTRGILTYCTDFEIKEENTVKQCLVDNEIYTHTESHPSIYVNSMPPPNQTNLGDTPIIGNSQQELIHHIRDELITQSRYSPEGINEHLVAVQAYRWDNATEERIIADITRLIERGDIQVISQDDKGIRYIKWVGS